MGSLGGEINAGLVESESAASYAAKAVAWDSKKRLELALPFQDMKPSLFLGQEKQSLAVLLVNYTSFYCWTFLCFLNLSCNADPFLPRVCELAVSSSDRQTKACGQMCAAVFDM